MGVNYILLGQSEGHRRIKGGGAYNRYFVDVVCDGRHEGNCGSDNPVCDFKNLTCFQLYKKCKHIATEASILHQVPLVDERTKQTHVPYKPVGTIEGHSLDALNIWKIHELPGEVLAGFHGQAPAWCSLEDDDDFGRCFEFSGTRYFLDDLISPEFDTCKQKAATEREETQ